MAANLRILLGLDFHLVATLVLRGWSILAGGLTLLILSVYLNPVEQGYYFTFGSILALQIFFELGLNQILIQMVAHEVANLTPAGVGYVGQNCHISRLKSLVDLSNRWYKFSAVIFAIVAIICGAFFLANNGSSPVTLWLGAWIVLVMVTALNLWLSPKLAVYEGCGKIGQIAWLRFSQSVFGYIALWTALICGAGLWAIVCLPAIYFLHTSLWLIRYGNFFDWLSKNGKGNDSKINWKADVLPLQWRMALSWVSGYLIFNLFVPLTFSRNGPIEAGQLGIALTIFSAISTIGMSWISSKSPKFTVLIAQEKRAKLNNLFKAVFIRSTIVVGTIEGIFILVMWYLDRTESPIRTRIAPLTVLVVLAILTLANTMVFAMASYMRAYRKEPMLLQSIIIGLLVSVAAYITSEYGVFIMMLSYMAICIFISLPWTTLLFFNFYKKA